MKIDLDLLEIRVGRGHPEQGEFLELIRQNRVMKEALKLVVCGAYKEEHLIETAIKALEQLEQE